MFEFSILMLGLIISTMFLHEMGHILYLKAKKIPYETKGWFRLEFDDKKITISQQLGIYWSGILLGVIPTIVSFFIVNFFPFSKYGLVFIAI